MYRKLLRVFDLDSVLYRPSRPEVAVPYFLKLCEHLYKFVMISDIFLWLL